MTKPRFPGLYVEEVASGPKPIEGVATDVATFLGLAPHGPTEPQRVTSLADYERLYGGGFADPGYLHPALAGFFENGGRSAVVARIVPATPGSLAAADFDGAIAALEAQVFDDVSLVYAPDAQATPRLVASLVAHGEKTRRFVVIDAPAGASGPVRPADTPFAACYHPWIEVADPATGAARLVPPGGHVLGVYTRVDRDRGVFKAPANEALMGATGLAEAIGEAEGQALSAAGISVIRHFPGRGILVWGARTVSSDPEWKYVNVRRFLSFLERSIEQGTQWAVFEPNGEALWARVRGAIETFLHAQWRAGALLGIKPDEAFFVRCDRTTMTQDDIDRGRLVCLVGVAPLRPAEFVMLRVGQQLVGDG